jgi:hypothetical protein
MSSGRKSSRESNNFSKERESAMKNLTLLLTLIFITTSLCVAHDFEEKQEIKKTLRFQGSGEKRTILVDNIRGSIDVRGYDGDSVELIVHRTNFADSQDKLEEAKTNVVLDIKEEKDRVLLYVDAPWRTSDGINYRGWHYYGYDVECDFELRVPVKANLYIKTVNDGDITVKDIRGEYEVQNVNGGIEMENIVGSGKACTVNGPVKVKFSRNPDKDCKFKTVNGKVDVEFPDGLAADLNLKTFNGSVYTDFDVVGLPQKAAGFESRGSRKVYMSDKSFSVRVGKGGPELSFDTLNGNVHILKRED